MPGATTCNLGINAVAHAGRSALRELNGYTDPEIQKLRIKISGCPNPAGIITLRISDFMANVRKVGEPAGSLLSTFAWRKG